MTKGQVSLEELTPSQGGEGLQAAENVSIHYHKSRIIICIAICTCYLIYILIYSNAYKFFAWKQL